MNLMFSCEECGAAIRFERSDQAIGWFLARLGTEPFGERIKCGFLTPSMRIRPHRIAINATVLDWAKTAYYSLLEELA